MYKTSRSNGYKLIPSLVLNFSPMMLLEFKLNPKIIAIAVSVIAAMVATYAAYRANQLKLQRVYREKEAARLVEMKEFYKNNSSLIRDSLAEAKSLDGQEALGAWLSTKADLFRAVSKRSFNKGALDEAIFELRRDFLKEYREGLKKHKV